MNEHSTFSSVKDSITTKVKYLSQIDYSLFILFKFTKKHWQQKFGCDMSPRFWVLPGGLYNYKIPNNG